MMRARVSGSRPVVVATVPPPKPPCSLPEPVPIIHSTAFIREHNAALLATDKLQLQQAGTEDDDEKVDLSGSALVWALKRVDKSLDEIEMNPSTYQKAIYDVSRGPVGQATAKGVEAAAKLTVNATVEAAKLAAPVGKWAVKEGTKVAFGLFSKAMQQQNEQQQKTAKQQRAGKKK